MFIYLQILRIFLWKKAPLVLSNKTTQTYPHTSTEICHLEAEPEKSSQEEEDYVLATEFLSHVGTDNISNISTDRSDVEYVREYDALYSKRGSPPESFLDLCSAHLTPPHLSPADLSPLCVSPPGFSQSYLSPQNADSLKDIIWKFEWTEVAT